MFKKHIYWSEGILVSEASFPIPPLHHCLSSSLMPNTLHYIFEKVAPCKESLRLWTLDFQRILLVLCPPSPNKLKHIIPNRPLLKQLMDLSWRTVAKIPHIPWHLTSTSNSPEVWYLTKNAWSLFIPVYCGHRKKTILFLFQLSFKASMSQPLSLFFSVH